MNSCRHFEDVGVDCLGGPTPPPSPDFTFSFAPGSKGGVGLLLARRRRRTKPARSAVSPSAPRRPSRLAGRWLPRRARRVHLRLSRRRQLHGRGWHDPLPQRRNRPRRMHGDDQSRKPGATTPTTSAWTAARRRLGRCGSRRSTPTTSTAGIVQVRPNKTAAWGYACSYGADDEVRALRATPPATVGSAIRPSRSCTTARHRPGVPGRAAVRADGSVPVQLQLRHQPGVDPRRAAAGAVRGVRRSGVDCSGTGRVDAPIVAFTATTQSTPATLAIELSEWLFVNASRINILRPEATVPPGGRRDLRLPAGPSGLRGRAWTHRTRILPDVGDALHATTSSTSRACRTTAPTRQQRHAGAALRRRHTGTTAGPGRDDERPDPGAAQAGATGARCATTASPSTTS